jgi:hypothetical protein
VTDNALLQSLFSDHESDVNGDPANVVDGLFAIARALERRRAAEEEPC